MLKPTIVNYINLNNVKYIVDNYYPNVQYIDFMMRIIRPNGDISG